MKLIRKSFRWLAGIVAGFVTLLVVYAAFAGIGALVPVNAGFTEPADGIDIYIVSNGVHADIVVPVTSGVIDWRTRLPMADFGPHADGANYIAFGWGDKAIFIDTPTWADLKFSTAVRALVGANGSAMHVEPRFIRATAGPLPDDVVRVRITPAQLGILTRHIENGFVWGADGRPQKIASAIYTDHDAFYRATGSYSAYFTCNEWLRRGLAEAGIRVPLWAPFVTAIFYQLHRIGN